MDSICFQSAFLLKNDVYSQNLAYSIREKLAYLGYVKSDFELKINHY